MAQIRTIKPPKPIEITQFFGLNESVGDTEIKLGEAVRQENFRITKNYKPQKRSGHQTYIQSDNPIRGWWEGELLGVKRMLFSTGGFLYSRNMEISTSETQLANMLTGAWDDTELWDDSAIWDESADPIVSLVGAIADEPVQFLWFDGKVQIKTATQWKTYDGTTYTNQELYVPVIAIESPPAGGGTLFEEINLLTTKKTQKFRAAGTATLYQLAEKSVSAINVVMVNGVIKTLTTDYSVNLTNGTVTFVSAPTAGAEVEITWTKANVDSSLVMNHPYMIDFGVENDTNLFLFGGSHEKSTFRYSMVGKPNYFPANAFVKVGSNQFAITDLIAQQQTLLIFKEDSTRIVSPEVNPLYSSNTGLNPYNFGYRDLNEHIGHLAPNQGALVEDFPITLDGFSMWRWEITSVETQRSAKPISDRLKISLQDLDLSQAKTLNYQNEKEYWVCVDGKVYIWNYGNDTMYIYTNVYASDFLEIDGDVYYYYGNQIRRFDDSFTSDDTSTIPCKLYTGFTDFGALQYRKMMRDEWVAIAPNTRTSVNIKFVTDRVEEVGAETYSVEYRYTDFNDIDHNDISFNTNANPQPKRLKAKVKKFTYLQVLFENDTDDETLTILKLLMNAQSQGYSR